MSTPNVKRAPGDRGGQAVATLRRANTAPAPQLARTAVAKAVDKLAAEPRSDAWIEIELVDGDGKAIGGAAYRMTLPDGREVQGRTRPDGVIRLTDIFAGECRVAFPDVTEADSAAA